MSTIKLARDDNHTFQLYLETSFTVRGHNYTHVDDVTKMDPYIWK